MKTEWNLEPLIEKDLDEEKKEVQRAYFGFRDKWRENLEYLENPETLKEALDEYESLLKNYGLNHGYYYNLREIKEQDNAEVRAKFGEIEKFAVKMSNEIKFFILNLGKVPLEKQKEFLGSNLLKNYKHFLEILFVRSKYFLEEGEEKIMSLKENSSYELWTKMLSSLLSKETREVIDEKGKKVSKTYPELISLMQSSESQVRDLAAEKFEDVLEEYSDVAEFELNAILEHKKANDEIRGFERADTSRHISDDIETEIVDSLIQAVTQKFDIAKRYYELKSKIMKVPKLKYHERVAEIGEVSKEYSFEESVKTVKKVFYSLDSEFGEMFDKYLENGQIDAFPKKGKSGGAFCFRNTVKDPTYILLNHTNKLQEVLTIAHESGHGLNNEFMKKKSNELNFGTPKSTAEVASTFMEDFVLEELLKNANEEERFSILIRKLEDDIATIIRQTACYNLELELHETYRKKGYLSKEKIGEIFKKHMQSYMGDFVDCSKSDNWWIYWHHLRLYFYVYSYSSGLLISKAMQKKVKENPEFIEKVKEFLSAGTSQSPKEIFLDLGIDISKKEFWENGLKEVENLLNETENLAKKLGKI